MSEETLQGKKRALPPFRADQVGSLLRTEALKTARAAFQGGKITREDLRATEDEEIAKIIAKQAEAGLKAVTDGEFRRTWWHLDFLWGLVGVEPEQQKEGSIVFSGNVNKTGNIKIVDKIDFPSDHPFIRDFLDMQRLAGNKLVKFTIPSPSMLHLIATVRPEAYEPIPLYREDAALRKDIVAAYQKAILALYDAGCRYLQLDDTSWGEFCSEEKREIYRARGFDLDALEQAYAAMINEVVSVKPADLAITMHICRGNFRSTWFSSGGYAPVAETLFGGVRVDGFFLEYDTERSGDFSPLCYIKDQQVVLGLITSKFGELEDKKQVMDRIREAAQFVPLNQLALSPQCGFSSTEEGNLLSEEQQWAKLALVVEIADEIWK